MQRKQNLKPETSQKLKVFFVVASLAKKDGKNNPTLWGFSLESALQGDFTLADCVPPLGCLTKIKKKNSKFQLTNVPATLCLV